MSMNKNFVEKDKTDITTNQEKEECSSITTHPSLVENSTQNKLKRSLSPDNKPPSKRRRVSEVGGSSSSNGNVEKTVRVAKRKLTENEERPKKRFLCRDLLKRLLKQKLQSSSNYTDASCSSDLESHDIPDGDIRKKTLKRKADDAGETSSRKKKRTETKQDRINTQRAEFQAKYEEQGLLGEGGCGSVFAGHRRSDNLQVAIKHIQKNKVISKHKDENGRLISVEVAVMLKLQEASSGSAGQSAPVSLLDWYDLGTELILVLERPMPAEDLWSYINNHSGVLEEDEAKIILKQLLDAALHLQENNIFHRDIKPENILIETGSTVPRVRLIDFGMSCFYKQRSHYSIFCGTRAHIPPEWVAGKGYTAGPTTTWQMGVVLYEFLHKADFSSTGYLLQTLRFRDDLSAQCQDFLWKCLTLNPRRRPSLQELQRHQWLM